MLNKKYNKLLRKKRFIKNKINSTVKRKSKYYRRLKRKKRGRKKKSYSQTILIKSSKIINLLNEKNFKKKVRRRTKNKNTVIIEIPETYSFIDNPDQTISTLKKISYCGTENKIKSIFLDYGKCKNLGLCASLVTDLILVEVNKYRKIELSGNYPNDKRTKKMFSMTGLPKHLNLINYDDKNAKVLETLSNLDISTMSEKLVDYYDNCLKTQNHKLTDVGRNKFGKMFGEVFDNASKYCGSLGSWHALGYYDISEEDDKIGKFRLVLMNFGNSIYEGLKASDTTDYTKKQLKKQTKKVKKMFNFMFNEEVLWTLFSLQKNVSKKRRNKKDTKGKGTIDLIDSFMKIGATSKNEKPKMSITSGACQILFDGKYSLKNVKYKNGSIVPIIAFNDKNSLSKKPDPHYVYKLNNYFCGTIISMEFYLKDEYFDNSKKGE